jgi:hypothetical protein
MNATRKPNHEKRKTRPYWSNGLNRGTDFAFRVIGLISGEAKSTWKSDLPMVATELVIPACAMQL